METVIELDIEKTVTVKDLFEVYLTTDRGEVSLNLRNANDYKKSGWMICTLTKEGCLRTEGGLPYDIGLTLDSLEDTIKVV